MTPLGKLRLTERDYDVMCDLYHLRALTIDQIAALRFPKVTSGDFQAARKRLWRLAGEGYLRSRRYYVTRPGAGIRRGGKVYMLTDKGMYAVCRERGLKYRKAEDNAVTSAQLRRQLLTNWIPAQIARKSLPWEWLESREAKSAFDLSYRGWLSGVLVPRSGGGVPAVAVFVVPTVLGKNSLGGLAYDIILAEKKCPGAEMLVLTPGDASWTRSGLVEYQFPGVVVRVLAFQAGLKVVSEFLPRARSILSSWLGPELSPASVPPARWKVPGEFYIADCATGDISPVRSLQTVGWHGNLPLKVIAPASWEEHLNYPGVEVVPPPPGWDTLVPPVPELVGPAAREDPGELEPGYDETWLDATGWE